MTCCPSKSSEFMGIFWVFVELIQHWVSHGTKEEGDFRWGRQETCLRKGQGKDGKPDGMFPRGGSSFGKSALQPLSRRARFRQEEVALVIS